MRIKQKRFCEEYIKCWNASESARNAGYSERNAANTGWKLLQQAHVVTYIQKLLKDMQLTPEAVKSLISEKAKEGNLKALEMMGKIYGLFTDKVEHVGDQRHSIRVEYDNSYTSPTPPGTAAGYRDIRDKERLGLRPEVGEGRTRH